MKEFIERAAALSEISRFVGYIDPDMIYRIQHALSKIPAADVVEKKAGEWTDINRCAPTRFQLWTCSCCGYSRSSNWEWEESKKPKAKYCENCGTEMRDFHG